MDTTYFTLWELLKSGHFPDVWKKSIIVPVHKKGDKQLIKSTDCGIFVANLQKIIEKTYVQLNFQFCW